MRSWLSLGALFVVVLALGAWIYYKPSADVAATHALSALKSGDVKRIRFQRTAAVDSASAASLSSVQAQQPAGTTVIALDRRNDSWLMTAPLVARAEKFQVERMLSILEARSVVRYAAADLSRYGLDTPQVTLTLEDQVFAYGAINNLTREQYVLTGNAIFLVPLAYSIGLPRNVDALLALRLFDGDEAPARFELPGFSVALREGTWTVTPATNDAGPDERHAWVDTWRNASAIRAARSVKGDSSEAVKVGLKDGRTITLAILQREPELVLLRRDEGIEYHFFGDSGKRLITPPGAGNREPVSK
jgi:uncharacterized protein DUF4340